MSFLQKLFGTGGETTSEIIKTPLDMVTHAASLVSNPSGIDPLLDRVRAITAELSSDRKVSPVDEKELVTIYFQIEQYLITEEPMRTFHRDDLRRSLSPDLLQLLAEYEKTIRKESSSPKAML
jgi:hypothetical protein